MPEAARRTGLVLLTPDVDPVVDRWRRRYDPVRAYGMPAHVTILYPWLRYDDITDSDRAALAGLCRSRRAVEMTFAGFGRFPATLWLDPEPAEPIVQLVGLVAARWPEHPPFAGAFATVIPHLTLADGHNPDALADVVADVEPRLPLHTVALGLTLMRLDGTRWHPDSEYPFAS